MSTARLTRTAQRDIETGSSPSVRSRLKGCLAPRENAWLSQVCVPSNGFVRAAGDVSLGYALEHMQRAAPRFAKDANGFLKRLKG